jgi:manganese/iron transport system ATP-binding protein
MSVLTKIFRGNYFLKSTHLPHLDGRPLLQIEHVSVQYENAFALDDISFAIEKGMRVALIGPNGAGKSTLFKVIAGVIEPSKGKVLIYGSEPTGHICIAYVPQRSQVEWNFPANVTDVVMMGRVGQIGFLHRPSASDWEKVYNAIETVDLQDLRQRQINELSGGQQQRVFIARALAQEAELMLLDEPMAGLDANSQDKIFTILDKLKEKDITSLVSLHDMKMARDHFHRVMLINKRLMGFGRPEEVFNSKALAEAYQSHLHFIPAKDGKLALSDMCCNDEDPNHD